ncbi:hypothetical protein CRU87_04085 [Aliarcobacter trophiarum LMG 25534]|uniref:Uncharacterized protein n=1 Tax=Aliarcobacter trophiarum LMG 25534 TaxID=1032241 RepID=A0AAD0QKB0_9BACT|nr:hypothetical protein [Aliarcobacter trophiarum]AXK49614.1 hypothetical protein ATR_1791 [Aliarcobacter trophiarum LMG 25534]RXI27469.1 hypothetical protein CRU89_05400 [Aliarcobacter trophiarum]RXJ92285.1 hypothetical protein CRU87_04085 [Aliarcobacter trophiarum LMG 25534]
MFKKETMFINVVKQNNNLKVEYKKYINNKEQSEDNSTFLLDGDILPDNIVQKLNNLQNENDLSYISTLLLSDTTKLIPKSISPKVKDCEIINFNEIYDIVVLKTTLFETQNYFGKTGVDYIYSAFHIMNAHIQKQNSKNELLFFIYNDRAYILIVDKNSKIVYNEVVDLLTFDAVKRTHFYEDNLEGQKLFDELYYLELNELLQKILKNFHESQKEVFIQKISFLFALRNLTKEQLTNLSLELMLKIDDYSVDIHDELFTLSRNTNISKSFIVPRKKKKKRDSRYIFVFILFALMLYGGYKIYNMIDFRSLAVNLNLIEAKKNIQLEKLPDHILNNSKIEERVKAIFKNIPQSIVINELTLTSNTLELKIKSKDSENLNLLKTALSSIYQTIETKKLDEKQESDFEAIVVAKGEIELKDIIYGIFTKDYLQDELFDKDSIYEQLKILLPEHSIIKYIETYNANKVEVFTYSVNIIIQEPKELFNLFTNINSELYSITISKPILMKNRDLGIEVDFIIEFNQLKN